ncbi:MAG: pre-mycofactocin synthase MftD [Gulosibacter sp.]|uniref:pre-mycofactocin synthase MftD n=1 Tax=Gulosibacter sp. TaxID=2817531 RepID=UPI003F8D9EEE
MFSRTPIETVADARRRARKRLPKSVYRAVLAGNESGVTLRENVAAFEQIGLVPRVGAPNSTKTDYRTTFMNRSMTMPLMMSPAGAQALHAEGELPVARATAAAGISMGHSNFASSPYEEIVRANRDAIFQLYWIGSRDEIAARLERMKRAGSTALIVTMDAMPWQSRDWGSPAMPAKLDLPSMVRFAPMALSRPAWLASYLARRELPDLTVPNFGDGVGSAPTMMEAFMEWLSMDAPLPTWEDVAWLREQWDGPLMVKGIWHPDDALRAIDVGATAIGVSNHGGNNLDSTMSPLRALPAIAEAVNGQAEISFDSGVRRGGDIVKAIALGADIALAGRMWLFALSADGERGVSEILAAVRTSLEKVMIGLGHTKLDEISREDLLLPEGFVIERSVFKSLDPIRA